MHRLHQFIDVLKAVLKLRARRVHIKRRKFLEAALNQKPGMVYRVAHREQIPESEKTL